MTVGSISGTYGLSGSGMDIDSLVKKLMSGQQAKDDALVQKKTVIQWQKTAFNTVYDDISNFRSTVFNYKLQATLSPNKVSSSNTSVATATAGAGAADVSHSLKVTQLANGVNLTSSVLTSSTLGTLATQVYNNINVPASAFSFTITNGTVVSQPISIDPNTATINDVVSAINNAGVNVKATYDSTLNRFFLSTTNTGQSAGISISGDANSTDFFNTKLGLPLVSNGQDAQFNLDGVNLSEASNAFAISGVSYNLTGVSQNDSLGNPIPTTISVTNDVDTAVASIQSMVDSYNKILDELNGKLNETRYTDYPPLTDAQKAAMKDSDITLWNQKAQSGMLHNDTTLTNLVNTMRNAFSSPVTGITGTTVSGTTVTYNTASSIGITTGDYSEGGKLYLNTDKLRAALQANPNVLNQLFGASGTTTTNGVTTTNSQSQGIAGRLYDGIKNTMDQLAQIAGTTINAQYDTTSNLAQEITDYNRQISDATDIFNTMQSQYYTQYNAMEVALQKLNAQSSWFASQMGTSSGG